MCDEAFARRFYADRAELASACPCLAARRVHRRGALHAPRGAVLPAASSSSTTTSSPRCRPCLDLLDGQFAYAEPLRLALQNLALGRPVFAEQATDTAVRVEVLDPRLLARDAGPARQARGCDLEAADDQVSATLDLARRRGRAHCQPLRAPARTTASGTCRPRPRARGRSARSASRAFAATSASPPGASATSGSPPISTSTSTAAGRRGRSARPSARHASRSPRDTAWWVDRAYGTRGSSRAASSSPTTRRPRRWPRWIMRQDGRAIRSSPPSCAAEVARGARAVRERHQGPPPEVAPPTPRAAAPTTGRAARGAGRTGALRRAPVAARLPPDALRRRDVARRSPPSELVERFHIPEEELEEHLSLLNLVNFGGGCYAVYARSTATRCTSTRSSSATRSVARRG